MDLRELIELGGMLALLLFTGLFLLSVDWSLGGDPQTVKKAEKATRFLYAGVMTIAPTSEIAVLIDVGAAVVASLGFVRGAKNSIKAGIVAAAFVYFFTGFIGHYLTAPI